MSFRSVIVSLALISCTPPNTLGPAEDAARLGPPDGTVDPRDAAISRADAYVERQIGDCSSIAASAAFEDVTPAAVDDSLEWRITNVVADPIHLGTVYVGTEHRGIFRSTDCGATWVKVNTGRNGSVLDEGLNWVLAIDPLEPNVLYAGSSYSSNNGLFKSTNSGVDWDPLWTPGSIISETVEYSFLNSLSMDPTDPHHLVVTFHANCRGYTGCMGESTDAGASWRLFETPLPWGEGASTFVLGASTIIFATLQNGAFYTSDGGLHWEQVGPGNNGSLYRASDGTYYAGSDYGIQRSRDGHHWEVIVGSPPVYGIAGDGTRMIASLRYAGDGQPFFTSLESDGATWAPLASPSMAEGPVFFSFDPAHRVYYGAATHSGLWRIRATP